MDRAEPAVAYRFDAFRLDPARGTLRRGEEDLVLRPKAFALLRHLVEQPGRLLRRADLLDALWPDVIVSDDSLTQCVSDLRRALGDRAEHVLRTLPRRGYVLAAEVRREGPEPEAAATPAAAVPSPAALRRDSLIVRPFQRPDASPAASVFAEALTSDLIAAFSRFEDLRVVPSPAGQAVGLQLQGEVRDAGTDWQVTARLDAADGTAFWAERLRHPKAAGPELPPDVLQSLVIRIYRQVDLECFRRATLKPHAERTARELTWLGKELHGRGTEADTIAARGMFDAAIERDPDYALAYAWQAYTVARGALYGWGDPSGDAARDLSLRYARRGAQLEPDSPLCLARLAFTLAINGRWEEAVQTARAAPQTGRPAYSATRATCAEVLAQAGFAEEAAEALQQALALEPLRPASLRAVLGRTLVLAGRPEEALDELRWCAARLPDYAPCFHSLVVACAETGRLEEARTALREVERLYPGWVPRNFTGQWYFRRPGDAARFEAAFRAAGHPRVG
ncbi:winged helix-turn-helix domain-containing protein [Roseomonas sp. CCTCC AB2023176]|uniref:winged helix-turn-helix domain-containing protein n=1 Tax=Roseomonas sp. CCTCC AB2023176 TaxID=3342640 RepID=UPI0035DA6D2B